MKLLHVNLLVEDRALERFEREARAAATLRSRHAVRVLDIDVTLRGEPYIVMELLDGANLSTRVADNGPLEIEPAVRYMLQACDALAEAHDAGILHRDIKPENLFLANQSEGEPIVKVVDFGLAKALPGGDFGRSDDTALTATATVLGTPRFMSPEQFRGRADQRSDVWSLGVTLYFLLAGGPPFNAWSFEDVREQIGRGEYAPLTTQRDDVPAELEAVIARCLRVDPRERWQSVRELAGALLRVPQHVRQTPRRSTIPGRGQLARTLPFELGRYTVHERIAAGGMGTVYLARVRGALGFSKPVAVKHLHAHLAQDAETRRRFLEEARVVSLIDHPNVVQVLDVVEQEQHVFLVLEYVHGASLDALLRASSASQTPPPINVLASIFVDVAAALHAAHEATGAQGAPLGLVHRDVSPHNILVASRGAGYVTDFGIAKVSDRLSKTGSGIMGKAGYMAPEQRLGAPLTAAADLFALGVVMWEALTLSRFYDRGDDGMMREMLDVDSAVRRPSSQNPLVPRALDELVLSMLARDPQARPASALDVAERIKAAVTPASANEVGAWVKSRAEERLARLGSAVDRMAGADVPDTELHQANAGGVAEAHPTVTSSPATLTGKDARSRTSRLLAGGFIAVLAVVGGGVMSTRISQSRRLHERSFDASQVLSDRAPAAAFGIPSGSDPTDARPLDPKAVAEPPASEGQQGRTKDLEPPTKGTSPRDRAASAPADRRNPATPAALTRDARGRTPQTTAAAPAAAASTGDTNAAGFFKHRE